MPKMIFINLPVTDLAASAKFYEALGCEKNAQFSDENATSMVWSDAITFMLLKRDYFATFTSRPVAEPKDAVGVLLALSCDSREDVDKTAEAAGAAGGKLDVREPQDLGFMYQRAVEDPDGHTFELAHMDMSKVDW
ncbi:VOC family protein [Pelagibacterium sp. 26DY04]|uniref:VOC family protein n=1 Tax=Pelagibacterium sp. 26DY04 TaxID=2967130 RepID=UPI0028164CDC|nr:VOC family protein [Pelagibacterium sp. 26DY04]WMT88531.1 VOC family protein [Pelagibacterium sp. 26DY04]